MGCACEYLWDNAHMICTIQRICPREESVFLQKADTGVVRQISVPGAESARLDGNHVIIHCKTGFSWVVDPETGARKRFTEATG